MLSVKVREAADTNF